MPSYRFDGAYGRVFPDLQVGDDVTVRTAADGPSLVVGQTVYLGPGDVLTTVDSLDHPELTAVDDQIQQAPKIRTPRVWIKPEPADTILEGDPQ